jgi:hypothetical protein
VYPTANNVDAVKPTITVVQMRPRVGAVPVRRQVLPPPTAGPSDGTFPYDGGPVNPVPLPRSEPSSVPGTSTAAAGNNQLVSLQAGPAKYVYLAYGEKPAGEPRQEKLPVFRVTMQAAR